MTQEPKCQYCSVLINETSSLENVCNACQRLLALTDAEITAKRIEQARYYMPEVK